MAPPWLEVLLTDQASNDNFYKFVRSLAAEPVRDTIKIGRLLLMVVYNYEDEAAKADRVPKKVYMMINGKKNYIDPEIVKKYDLDEKKVSGVTGRKLYVEKD